jgi:hypothetical protein
MKDRQIILPPYAEQFTCPEFRIRVISLSTPIFNVRKSFLNVNKNQCRPAWFAYTHVPKVSLYQGSAYAKQVCFTDNIKYLILIN